VILQSIEGVWNGSSACVAHRADQPIAAGDFVLGDFEKVDTLESQLNGPLAEVFEWSVFVAPAADRLVDGFAS
jgi:hypothetical protein